MYQWLLEINQQISTGFYSIFQFMPLIVLIAMFLTVIEIVFFSYRKFFIITKKKDGENNDTI